MAQEMSIKCFQPQVEVFNYRQTIFKWNLLITNGEWPITFFGRRDVISQNRATFII
jgi:hypothetical protein